MSSEEFIIRGMVAAILIGAPSYGLGIMIFRGKPIARPLLVGIGAAAGTGAALVILIGHQRDPGVVAAVAAITAVLSAAMFAAIPEAQQKIGRGADR
jgi:ABC-type cobalamin transport system permease subunit